jgi:hypothetical protein
MSILSEIKVFGVIAIAYIILYIPSVVLINKSVYNGMYKKINSNVPEKPLINYYGYIILHCLIIALAIDYFGVHGSFVQIALVSVIISGTLASQNLANISNYDNQVAAIDAGWRLLFMIVTTFIGIQAMKMFGDTHNASATDANPITPDTSAPDN